MEEEEKIRFVFVLSVVFFVFQSTWIETLNFELFKWISLVTGLTLLLAILLFAVDGIALDIIPDNLAKLIAWVGIFLASVVMLFVWLLDPAYLNFPIP